MNWSTGRKTFVFFQICLLTFAVYSGSAIISPAQPTFVEIFGISSQASTLVMSMFVLGYGIGPLFFSPLSEVPRVGRNIPYMTSFFLFILMTVAASRVSNYPGLVVLRFLQGFLGGPVLATGGASAADIFGFLKIPYALTFWTCAAYGGPALGPLLSGFSVTNSTWRWSMYELLILSGATFVLLFFCLPETNPETILLLRARRLRMLTGNLKLRSQSEIKQEGIHIMHILARYLTTPFRVTIQDPSIAFINVYTALIYGIYYSFFESFPLVYVNMHGFSMGMMGVVFLCLIIACIIGASAYLLLVWLVYEPYTMRVGIGMPEHRLLPGVFTAALAPAGLFIFAWTSRPDIHWIAPTIGILASVIFIYLPTSYPRYAASLFAANTFFRSILASTAIHFSQPLFQHLGIGRGCSVLGGLTAGCFLGVVALWRFGPSLRARSRFAESY
ncbi:cycloheximide resistance protein [Aspergillus campestris IBT 28561]|uniref:Cycloheximide resistance protein n=1 Tax=Aspergillus campestris (strain IBT 28561) TaxID=1392248 RepID=A0A2I1DB32_ASPC2|nr:cycloheximide resistance protein [Aspergillus campestris IBT 28561]PKY07086.1 cycloheximide resistance protein [Aspergillus campestris IBT 28561]